MDLVHRGGSVKNSENNVLKIAALIIDDQKNLTIDSFEPIEFRFTEVVHKVWVANHQWSLATFIVEKEATLDEDSLIVAHLDSLKESFSDVVATGISTKADEESNRFV
ncbi:hypothetical protein T12_11128 [Trichinella patagoniensis]|uniref:Uncharacterized protein n=1 Tax=Trichinella patagoniensis TaxID=990121 RepID=A0A0V0Z2L5_9BILA|nr:hypothetical protein T12_6012 [Trichinella patagoniensis]KRY06821.1 hypothetical protein T12_1131 [Trichinella patagoniensis]KRY06826.1 hypothetical protein T12_11128 [Trichinella patagoniensis]